MPTRASTKDGHCLCRREADVGVGVSSPAAARFERAGSPSASATVMEDNSPGSYFGDADQGVDCS